MLKRLWQVGFRLLYHELAFCYDLVSRLVSLGHWRAWQRSALSHLPAPEAGIVLELAHGTGDLQFDLLRRGYRAVGLDLSPSMGQLARRKLSHAGVRANLIRGDATRLPLKNEAVAAIVCTFPTAFVFAPAALDEMARVLQAGGMAVIVLTGTLHGKGLRRSFVRQLYRLTGQRDLALDGSELADLFSTRHFSALSQVHSIGKTSVQIAILRRRTPPPAPHQSISEGRIAK